VKVAILRPKEYLEETTELFKRAGFEVIAIPFIKIVLNKEGINRIADLNKFDAIIVTSQTSARILVEHGFKHNNVIAIGKKTAEVLRKAKIDPKIPSKFDSKTLYNEFKDKLKGLKVAIVRSDKGDPILLDLPAKVEEVILYKIEMENDKIQREFIKSMNFDAIIFSSRMIARSFIDLANDLNIDIREKLKNKIVIAIGPPTKRFLEKHGIKPLMPDEYTFEGVLRLLMKLKNQKL